MSTPVFESATGRKRLLKTYEKCATQNFDDLLYCCAVTVEDAMLLAGGVPGVSYSFIQLFQLAIPIAQDMAKERGGALITTGVPDSHPGAGLELEVSTLQQELLTYIDERSKGQGNYGATRSGISFSLVFRNRREETYRALLALIEKGLVFKDENTSPPRYHTTGTP